MIGIIIALTGGVIASFLIWGDLRRLEQYVRKQLRNLTKKKALKKGKDT